MNQTQTTSSVMKEAAIKQALLIAGATGLVGKAVLKAALADPNTDHVYALLRRPLDIEEAKYTPWISDDLTPPELSANDIAPTVGVIALGTTIKKAGSKANLRRIDVDLVVNTATHMQTLGVKHLIIVSCLGANSKAMSHYLRCKGEMEQAVEALGVERVTFLHPGPLAGDREEHRQDEKWLQATMKWVKPLMVGRLKNYLPIEADTVAKAVMAQIQTAQAASVERLDSIAMTALAMTALADGQSD